MFSNILHLTSIINRILRVDKKSRVELGKLQKSATKKVFTKRHTFLLPDIENYFLLNELHALSAVGKLSPWKGRAFSVQSPQLVSEHVEKNSTTFSTELVAGDKLTFSEPDVVIKSLVDIFGFLTNIQMKLHKTEEAKQIATQSTFSLLLRGILYGLQAGVRNPSLLLQTLRSTIVFVRLYTPTLFKRIQPALIHGDLDSDNILVGGKTLLLADWENAVFSDPLYDLAQIPRLYQKQLGINRAVDFCSLFLKSSEEKRRWKALSIYGTLKSLALDAKNSHMSESAKTSLFDFVPTKSVFVKIYTIAFTLLETIYKLLPFLYKPTEKAIILCYHNIGLNNWQFSTDADEFSEQISFLNKTFKISKLSQVVKSGSGVAITFDDGYQSVIEFAFPLLKKLRKNATIFMVGNPEKAQRDEMNNQLPLLDDKELRVLAKEDWEIGFHTATHADLSSLSPIGLSAEIGRGKKDFEKRTKIQTRYFAYPKGYYSDITMAAVKNAEFEAAFTVDDRPFSKADDKYLFHRISIENNMSPGFLKTLLTPTGLRLWSVFMSIIRLKKNVSEKINAALKVFLLPISFFKKTGTLWFALICMLILVAALRGLKGNPTSSELNSDRWMDNGPLELSPERGRFALTYSLAEDHSFHFSLPIAKFALPDVATANGYFVSLFAPTVSYIVMPGYILGKTLGYSQVGSFAVISLFAVFNAVLIRAIAIRLGARPSAATIAAMFFLFATPAFPYAVTLYQHHISTFLILFSIYTLLRHKSPWALAIVWFCCAISISVDNPNLFLMFPIGLFALGRVVNVEDKIKKYQINIHWAGLVTMAVMVLPIAFFMYFNQMSYGNPFQLAGTASSAKNVSELHTPDIVDIGNQQIPDNEKTEAKTESRNALGFFDTRQLPNGLYEHFLSLDRGMITYTPIILIGFIGLLLLSKRNIGYTNLLAGVIGADILLYSMWGDPYGGWAFGSRYMIPAYSILAILLGQVISHWRKNILILFTILVIGMYAVSVNTIGAVTSNRNPPKVEVLAIEAMSHVQERYTFTRNMQMLNANKSKSFIFQEYAHQYLTAWEFTEVIIGVIGFVLLTQFMALFINRNRD